MIGFSAINFFRRKSVARLVLAAVVSISSALAVIGQTANEIKKPSTESRATPVDQATQGDQSGGRVNVNEAFELNIAERRYSQENFKAATAVGTDGRAANLNLQVGVALAAGRIDLLLRNVHGSVRFRGTLDRILEIINNRQALSPTVPAPAAPMPSPE